MRPTTKATIVIPILVLPLMLFCGGPGGPTPLTSDPISPDPAAATLVAPANPNASLVAPAAIEPEPASASMTAVVSTTVEPTTIAEPTPVVTQRGSKDKTSSAPPVPPGMVTMPGGRTKIGSTTKEIQEILDADPSLLSRVSPLDAETPQYTASVDPFHLMLTEVTNEQYREFVKATGHQPPQLWGEAAIEEARKAFYEVEANRTSGIKFSPKDWWDENWPGKEWKVEDKDLLSPVVYVDYSDALAYCEWAGLRLPTEEEFQHACRLKSDKPYPWGDDATPHKYAVSQEFNGVKGPMPVGIVSESKSPSGVYDLIGNAWEWTSSPYVEYKGWKPHKYTTGTTKRTRREQVSDPIWNGDRRVSAGGSYQLPMSANRCTIRRGTERSQKTSGVGFRAAASENPVEDISNALYNSKVRLSDARQDGVTFAYQHAFGWMRWDSRDSELNDAQTKELLKAIRRIEPVQSSYTLPEGYKVITGYSYFVFTPVEAIEATSDTQLERASLHTPVQLGYLSFVGDLVSPALPAGTYLVAFRDKGDHPGPTAEEKEKAKEEKVEYEYPAYLSEIDTKTANVLYFDAATGALAAHVPVTKSPSITKGTPGGTVESYVEKLRIKGPDGKPAFKEETWIKVFMELGTKASGRACQYELNVQPAEGFTDGDWIR
ncbi:MAG: SUMF1/EgtB/PvdO family nonheme iron enzyme [Planctomycetes bacterium]|nr:SUMF1/EgtB/PvdO family nonheme iron enzyme [Planctomycetota bacterium]